MTYGRSLFSDGINPIVFSQTLSLNSSDILFTRISCRGHEDINLKLTGIDSRKELMRYLKTRVASLGGMVIVSLRNFSQGWHSRFTLYNMSA